MQRQSTVCIRRTDYATPFYPQKLVLTSPTSGGRLVGIVRLRTKATEYIALSDISAVPPLYTS
jgi:hypothetical protein